MPGIGRRLVGGNSEIAIAKRDSPHEIMFLFKQLNIAA